MEDVSLSNPVTFDALPRQPRHQLACFERATSENNHFTNVYNRFRLPIRYRERAQRAQHQPSEHTFNASHLQMAACQLHQHLKSHILHCEDEIGRHTHHIRPVRVPV